MDLSALETFVAVVDHGGFSRAASALGIGKSTVSQRIKALEAELGAMLLQRTTRRMSLTQEGEELALRGREIMAAAHEASDAVHHLAQTAIGTLRVSVPVSFGQRFLGPVLTEMLERHARVQLEIDLADRHVDLVDERYDLAVRVGELTEPSLIAKRIGEARLLVVASPSYLADRGTPRRLADLQRHGCLLYTHQRPPDRWLFAGQGGPREVHVSGRLRCNHGDLLAEAALADQGLALLPEFIVAPHLASGALRAVLTRHCARLPIHLVYPERRYRPLKVRLFAELLEQTLRQ
jgi:DNA-binding transcriptional LysR family regulator